MYIFRSTVFHKVNANENSSQYCTYEGFAKLEIKRFVCVNTKMHLSDVVVCRHPEDVHRLCSITSLC